MKAVLIIYSPALECNIMSALKKAGQEKYSKIPYLLGVGKSSEPHLDTNIWPGSNSALLIITDERTKGILLQELKLIKDKYGRQGVKTFVWNIEEEL